MSAAKVWLKNGLLGLAAVAFITISVTVIRNYSRMDPFEKFRQPQDKSLEPRIAYRLEGVQVKHYRGTQLVASASADRIDQWKDGQTYDMFGVRDGKFSRDKESYGFEASHAQYYAPSKRLDVQQDAHLIGKDFDLKTEKAVYDGTAEIIRIATPLSGKAVDGNFKAASFEYNLKSESITSTNIEWKGIPKLGLTKQDDRTMWKFEAKTLKTKPGDKDVTLYTDVTATDGDLIIRAPKMEHNKKTDVLVATGGVTYFSGESNVACDKATVYRKEKRAVLEGKVLMLVKPKKFKDLPPKVEEIPPFKPVVPESIKITRPKDPADKEEQKQRDETLRSGKNLRDYPITIFSDKIEYWYAKGSRRAVITGKPQAHQELTEGLWRQVWAHSADYDGEAETLLLKSSPGGAEDKRETRMKNSNGDDMEANKFLVSTKEDDDSMSGEQIRGVAYTLDDEVEREKKKKAGEKKVPPPKSTLNGPIGKR